MSASVLICSASLGSVSITSRRRMAVRKITAYETISLSLSELLWR